MRPVPDGLKVRVQHERLTWTQHGASMLTRHEFRTAGLKPATKGGHTWATLLNEAGQVVAEGHAFCGPNENFSRRIGRDIAVGRAVKQYENQHESWKRR